MQDCRLQGSTVDAQLIPGLIVPYPADTVSRGHAEVVKYVWEEKPTRRPVRREGKRAGREGEYVREGGRERERERERECVCVCVRPSRQGFGNGVNTSFTGLEERGCRCPCTCTIARP